ncbi:MAG: type I CRISPR-associated protein Cas7 [Pseudomonadota bacterium]
MSAQEKKLWEKIKDKPYCDPARRMDFVIFFDVRDGNPNGDPDAGNLPRMDPETRQGIVTDVCIKRKVRDYLAGVLDRPIYIRSQVPLNTSYFDAARKIRDQIPKNEEAEVVGALLVELDIEKNTEFKASIAPPDSKVEAKSDHATSAAEASADEKPLFRDWLASISDRVDGLDFDPDCGTISYLGEANSKDKFKKMLSEDEFEPDLWKHEIDKLAKLLNDAKPKKNAQERKARDAVKRKMCELYDDIRLFGGVLTAGTNAGQIRGPMQLTFGRSVDPILQMDATITRCAITKASDWQKKQTEFGRKPWLSWAVYRQHGFFNPLLGRSRQQDGTGITRDDLARFWEAIACMFRNSDSASKGEMTLHDIIVFVHSNPRGNAPSHLLFEKVECKSKELKGTNDTGEKDDATIIKRDGFNKRYAINVGDSKIKPERPLRDLWEL